MNCKNKAEGVRIVEDFHDFALRKNILASMHTGSIKYSGSDVVSNS